MRMFIPSAFIIIFCISICRSQDTLFATITDTAEIPLLEIGGILGQPTGLDFQWWFTQRSAVHGILGYSFYEDGRFHASADYLYNFGFFRITGGMLPIHFGIGGVIRIGSGFIFGFRVPVGAEYILDRGALSLFAQIAPQVNLIDDFGYNFSGGVGVRLNFGTVGRR
ncbi:MAG: hypothetical protein GXY77_20390 [Fibrobacter sp.]|nr:hypothetical protein [Fibrobacter sp.]